MRIAYSLLLSDHVRADEADYADCATYGIVCPACHEAVFKRVRPTTSGETHYFAHYKKDPEATKLCEMRVDALTPQQMEATEIESRGQNLEIFRRKFQQALLASQSDVLASDPARLEQHRRMLVRKSLAPGLIVYARHVLHNLRQMEERRDEVATIINGAFPEDSILTRSRRIRSTLDLIEHLVTPQADSSLRFAVAQQFDIVARIQRNASDGAPRGSITDVLYASVHAIYEHANKNKKMRTLWPRLEAEYQSFHQPGKPDTLEKAVLWTLLAGLFTTLGTLPYMALLRETRLEVMAAHPRPAAEATGSPEK